MRLNRTIRVALAIFLALMGLFLAMIETIAILDPAGTQAADDANPFGPPPAWYTHIVPISLVLGFWLVAWLLLRRKAAQES
jgi:hypothetical protein